MEAQLVIPKSDSSIARCCEYVSEMKGATCPCCKTSMYTEALIVNQPKSVGSVAEVGSVGVTYSVMDDLTVVPMSKLSSITLLINKFQINDLASLEEKTVSVSLDEELKLLEASLQSKTVLTDVFLK
ncbi:hypothetical protein LUZ61_012497 [Rhynchospora tenuis]|uniref:Uncharacterized protein n=1 Tax=Rhynchospora tenuis TaxID=198213 RepID=A0AAD6F173_9POAL|nr:hypothetical protein LUZ61_012497 [Rhynchospora tenuis]